MFVEAREAVAAARRELSVGPSRDDPAFEQWSNASPGSPLLVHDEQSQPSYWLVPIRRGPVTVGAVRVLGSGQVAASVAYRKSSDVTSLDAATALELARERMGSQTGYEVGTALLVHDGPPGREAWRVEMRRHGRVVRWLFVTPGGTYERASEEPG